MPAALGGGFLAAEGSLAATVPVAAAAAATAATACFRASRGPLCRRFILYPLCLTALRVCSKAGGGRAFLGTTPASSLWPSEDPH